MCAYEVPDEGGRTEFVSERAAYARLPDAVKQKIEPLHAVHDYVFSRSKVGPDAVTPSHAASLPPVEQKLVRTNPRTGEKNFFVGSHAKEIAGWEFEESRVLIEDLEARATEAEHIYSHAWQPGDLVVWDNRCLLHRGSGYDADRYRRRMRQTRVAGTCSTLEE
jgi:alpha-ketoglutarate-dependent 2,4-dichlorophenoxyacetate dioxygenase